MNHKIKYLLKMLIIGLWLVLLAKLSYGQNQKFYIHDEQVFIGVKTMLDNYFDQLDSVEITQQGVIIDDVRYKFIEQGRLGDQAIGHWAIESIKDTVWYELGTCYDPRKKIYRQVKKKEKPTFEGFKKWLDQYFMR